MLNTNKPNPADCAQFLGLGVRSCQKRIERNELPYPRHSPHAQPPRTHPMRKRFWWTNNARANCKRHFLVSTHRYPTSGKNNVSRCRLHRAWCRLLLGPVTPRGPKAPTLLPDDAAYCRFGLALGNHAVFRRKHL